MLSSTVNSGAKMLVHKLLNNRYSHLINLQVAMQQGDRGIGPCHANEINLRQVVENGSVIDSFEFNRI